MSRLPSGNSFPMTQGRIATSVRSGRSRRSTAAANCGGDSLNAATRVPINTHTPGGWSNSRRTVHFLDQSFTSNENDMRYDKSND